VREREKKKKGWEKERKRGTEVTGEILPPLPPPKKNKKLSFLRITLQ